MTLALLGIVGSGTLVGCRGWRDEGNTFYAHRLPKKRARKETTYSFGSPGENWRPMRGLEDVQVAWSRPDFGAVITVHAQCDEQGDSSLEQYADHMRIDWTDWEVESQTEERLLDRAALRTIASARLDGRLKRVEMLLSKRAGCLFDLVAVGNPEHADALHTALQQVAGGFRLGE